MKEWEKRGRHNREICSYLCQVREGVRRKKERGASSERGREDREREKKLLRKDSLYTL